MSKALTELYRFVEMGFADPFTKNNKLYFCIAIPPSMNEVVLGTRTRLDLVKTQVNDALTALDTIRLQRNIQLDIGICAFSQTITNEMIRLNSSSADITALKAFVAGLTTGSGAPYDIPMQRAMAYYATPSPGFRRAMFFITDGEPFPVRSATSATTLASAMIKRTGAYSRTVDNDVSIYGIAVDLFDTTYLGMLDNTPAGGIQAISSSASQGLYNAIMSAEVEERLVWNYTNAPYEVEHRNEIYLPGAVSHSEVEVKEDMARANLDVTFDLNNPVARRWMKDSVEAIVTLTVWQVDEDDDSYVIWKGRLTGTRPNGPQIKLTFDSIYTSLARPGLGARYQRMCRHSLYGRGCKVAKSLHAVAGVPSAVAGRTVTIPEASAYPNGFFATGMIETPDGALRFITGHQGSQITLMRPMESLSKYFANQGYGLNYGAVYGGLQVKLYPGCDRSRQTCNDRFNNLSNYGGFDWIPVINPFAGSSIV